LKNAYTSGYIYSKPVQNHTSPYCCTKSYYDLEVLQVMAQSSVLVSHFPPVWGTHGSMSCLELPRAVGYEVWLAAFSCEIEPLF